MQLGPACFQKYSVNKDGLAVTTFLAREPAAGSERTDVTIVAWTDRASAARDFKPLHDSYRAGRMSPGSVFESLAAAGQPDTGALEAWACAT